MAPNLFISSSRESSAVKYFEIRLDESNLVLRGNENEAYSVPLKGTLVLCLSEPLRVQGIRLRFTGEKRVGWYQIPNGPLKHQEEFMRKVWDFKTSAETLSAGNYEFTFSTVVTGDTPESLEGLADSWLIYRMKATIERGMLQQNFIARKQVRIVRTMDPASPELGQLVSVDNTWPQKVEYSFSTASKAVIFGSTIQVDFRLIPLLKGLKIGYVTTELFQRQTLKIQQSRSVTRTNSRGHAVYIDIHHLPENAETEDIEGREGYVFSRRISIPQNLRRCVQTFDAPDIKVRHHLAFMVQLHNPDGHTSEIHATLPVYIFLSPNVPIDDNNNVVNSSIQQVVDGASELTNLTPPQYGEHTFDRLYSEIDPSGYMTPSGQSGVSTPINSRSRSVSSENLASMNAMAVSEFTPNALHYRLSNLDAAGPARSLRTSRERAQLPGSIDDTTEQNHSNIESPLLSTSSGRGHFADRSGNPIGQTSNDEIARRASGENPTSNPTQHIEYSAETLAKVPSYSTALQSNPRSPINEDLPTYQAATQVSESAPTTFQVRREAHQDE